MYVSSTTVSLKTGAIYSYRVPTESGVSKGRVVPHRSGDGGRAST
jgi:hypothetical protein